MTNDDARSKAPQKQNQRSNMILAVLLVLAAAMIGLPLLFAFT